VAKTGKRALVHQVRAFLHRRTASRAKDIWKPFKPRSRLLHRSLREVRFVDKLALEEPEGGAISTEEVAENLDVTRQAVDLRRQKGPSAVYGLWTAAGRSGEPSGGLRRAI
jgi:hypothetical protein